MLMRLRRMGTRKLQAVKVLQIADELISVENLIHLFSLFCERRELQFVDCPLTIPHRRRIRLDDQADRHFHTSVPGAYPDVRAHLPPSNIV